MYNIKNVLLQFFFLLISCGFFSLHADNPILNTQLSKLSKKELLQQVYLNKTEAKMELARRYLEGVDGFPQDLEVSFSILETLGRYDLLETELKLFAGSCYINGKYVKKNLKKAFLWNQEAAKDESLRAYYILAMLHEQGDGTPKNYKEALKAYKKAAENSNVKAIFAMADIFREGGYGVEKDDKRAFEYFKKASDLGLKKANYHLGEAYRFGRAVEKDTKKALEYFKDCGAYQSPYGDFMVGLLYAIQEDREQALIWLEKASKKDHAEADRWITFLTKKSS